MPGALRSFFRSRSRSQSRPTASRLLIRQQDGKFQIDRMGLWHTYWRDPYHLMLTLPWLGFIGVVSGSYILLNAIFALLYLAGGDCLMGARANSFEDAFFFSVHTFASIGYGVMAPKNAYANSIATLEAIASLLTIAVVTGLAFSRFSRPTARVIFSKAMVVQPYNGIPTLTLRAANQRHNHILEAEASLFWMYDEITTEGTLFRRFQELKLRRQRTPSFTLSWTIMHTIDATSPLEGFDLSDLIAMNSHFTVSLSGVDETVADKIYARYTYATSNIHWNHRFADIIYTQPNGDRHFDYSHFHDVEAFTDSNLTPNAPEPRMPVSGA